MSGYFGQKKRQKTPHYSSYIIKESNKQMWKRILTKITVEKLHQKEMSVDGATD